VIDTQTAPAPVARRSTGKLWRELAILLVAAVCVAFLVRGFVVQTFWIPSGSMEHTLNVNDRVLVNKLVYDFRDPRRGEVIVFTSPVSWRSSPDEKDFIKRVIGVGGDHVQCCRDGRVVVNGQPLAEPYLDADDGVGGPSSPDSFDVVVPPGRLWVMGDNRMHSGDSRQQYVTTDHDVMAATIPVSSVIGRAFVLFYPMGRSTWLTVPGTFKTVPSAPPGDCAAPRGCS
jgi:signal peptidase I